MGTIEQEITLEQLKKIELDILIELHDICVAQNLNYSLGGGTLLGAIRHNGFIPWDDDVDVMMPRPDYVKFVDYCKTHETSFKIKCFETDKNYVDLSAKIYNPKTVIIDDNIAGNNDSIGVYIDLFVIDGLGNDYKSALKAFRATTFKRELLVAAQWKKFFRSKTRPWYYEPIRFVFFILSRFVNKQKTFEKIERKYKNIDFYSVNYVAAVGGAYREREINERRVYTDLIDVDFEGNRFKAIAAYDEYLKHNYGDYMQLPPIEKRVSHHTFSAHYID